jgi:hypothetical protein
VARPCPAAASARDPRVKQGTGVAQLQAIRREQKMFRSEHTRSKFVSPIAEAASSPWGGILLDQRKLFGPPHCHGSPAAARGLLFNSQFFSFQEQNNCISCNFNRDPSWTISKLARLMHRRVVVAVPTSRYHPCFLPDPHIVFNIDVVCPCVREKLIITTLYTLILV